MDDELLNEETQTEEPTSEPATSIEESILLTIKKMIGFDPDYTPFDIDLIIFINSCFSTLFQLGVGPQNQAFKISGSSDTWSSFLNERTNIESVKEYIYLKCKIVFDPPSNSFVLTALTDRIKELEWRLNVEDDPGWKEEVVETTEEDD